MNVLNSIYGKLKDTFKGVSSSDIETQDKIKTALDNDKRVKFTTPKSERYTWLPNIISKTNEKWKPEGAEEKDTLAPIGFFRDKEIDTERQKKLEENLKNAAQKLGRKKLTKGQEKLVTQQSNEQPMYSQDVPSTAIKKIDYDPKTQSLYVTFVGQKKKYWYPRVPKEKIAALMEAPSKGEYFMQNIHDQYSVNYQLHHTHNAKGNQYKGSTAKKYYKNMKKTYDKGMKAGSMKGVLNNGK